MESNIIISINQVQRAGEFRRPAGPVAEEQINKGKAAVEVLPQANMDLRLTIVTSRAGLSLMEDGIFTLGELPDVAYRRGLISQARALRIVVETGTGRRACTCWTDEVAAAAQEHGR